MNHWCLWLWYVDPLNHWTVIDCIVWIGGIWESWSCWIMDLIGATYYNLKLFLTTAYSRSTNWSNGTGPNLLKNLNLMLLISNTRLSLMWQCWALVFTNRLALSAGQVALSTHFCELISVGHPFLALSAT